MTNSVLDALGLSRLMRGVRGQEQSWHKAALLLLALLVLVPATTLSIRYAFDGLYGQDAYAYYDYTAGPLLHSLLTLQPPPAFHWPPGYPLLVALVMLAVGTTSIAGQIVSLLAGSLVPVFTALLAYELWQSVSDARARVLVAGGSGLLVALNGQLWQSSVVVMADTTALATGTLGVLAVARYGRSRRVHWLALAAGALAWAILTRWAYVLVALPAALLAALVLVDQPRRRALQHASVAAAVAGVVLGPVLAAVVRDLLGSRGDYLTFAAAGEIYRWHPINALRSEHVTADGVLRYRLPNGLYYALTPARLFYFTPVFALFLVPGLLRIIRERRVNTMLVLIGWPAAVYIFHAGTAWQNVRFTLAYLPPLAILAAIGVATVSPLVAGAGWSRRGLRGLIVAGLLGMAIGGLSLTEGFISRMQADVRTVRWVEQQVSPDARILAFGLTLTLQHESSLDTHGIFLLAPDDIEELVSDRRATYLLLDVGNVETQWRGRAPEVNYQWLREHRTLIEIGQHRQYTLFEIGRRTVGDGQ